MLFRASLLASAIVAPAALANPVDIVTIGVSLDQPQREFGPFDGFYRLRGQSVYFSQRTNSGTTGGQLDGFDSRDSAQAVAEIQFGEAFPEANLTDYLTFGYFGVIDTFEFVDDGFGGFEEVLVDSSIIIAVNGLLNEDAVRVEDLLGIDEASLLAALTGSFDSEEFFDALDAATQNPQTRGQIALIQSDTVTTTFVRGGESLSLFAFIDGDSGDLGRSVGFIDTTILRIVPAPASCGVLAFAGLAAARRRRG